MRESRRDRVMPAVALAGIFAFVGAFEAPAGEKGSGDAAKLIRQLESPKARTRFRAARKLGEMGEAAGDAALPLVRTVFNRDEREEIRDAAHDAIVQIGAPLVPGFLSALEEKDPQTRIHAARGLGFIGSPAKDALPALRKRARRRGIPTSTPPRPGRSA